jgi:hypothetical protein
MKYDTQSAPPVKTEGPQDHEYENHGDPHQDIQDQVASFPGDERNCEFKEYMVYRDDIQHPPDVVQQCVAE